MFISYNKCNTPVGDGDNREDYICMQTIDMSESLYLMHTFAENLKVH